MNTRWAVSVIVFGCVQRLAAAHSAEPLYWDGGPVVVVNATDRVRSYVVRDSDAYVDLTRPFQLTAGAACRLDTGLYREPPDTRAEPAHFRVSTSDHGDGLGHFVEDVSEGPHGVMNGPFVRTTGASCTACDDALYGIHELQTCSAAAMQRCAGRRWGSWQVALLAPEPQTLDYPCAWHKLPPHSCRLEFVPNRLYWPLSDWGGGIDNAPSPFALRFRSVSAKALLLIQGGIDGRGFELHRLNPVHGPDLFGAPLCSALPRQG